MDRKRRFDALTSDLENLRQKREKVEQEIQDTERKLRILSKEEEIKNIIRDIKHHPTFIYLFNAGKNGHVECLESIESQLEKMGLVLDQDNFSYFFDVERCLREGPDNMDWYISDFDSCEGSCNSERKECPDNEACFNEKKIPKKYAFIKAYNIYAPTSENDAELKDSTWEGTSEFECSHATIPLIALCHKSTFQELIKV